MNIPETKHFRVEEFLHPGIFAYCKYAKGDIWRWYVSDFQIKYAILLRELTDAPLYLNDWHRGGRLIGRGTRPQYYLPKGGAKFSQHYFARALDCASSKYDPVELAGIIQDNFPRFAAIGLTTIENPRFTKTWLHGDCRQQIDGVHKPGQLLIVGGAL